MKPLLILLTAVALAAMTSAAFAQDSGAPPQINGTVVRGNTTIVFEAANNSDLPMALLKQWSGFARQHPKIERQLAYNPKLIDDPGYMRKNPDLAKLFDDDPALLAAMKRDPGNFAAIQPRPGE